MKAMKRMPAVIVGTCALSVAACLAIVQSKSVPLGIPGEWVWSHVRFRPALLDVLLAGGGLIAYAIFSALGASALREGPTRLRERIWVSLLFVSAVAVQMSIQSGGPIGHGSMKAVTLAAKGSSGYFGVARTQMAD